MSSVASNGDKLKEQSRQTINVLAFIEDKGVVGQVSANSIDVSNWVTLLEVAEVALRGTLRWSGSRTRPGVSLSVAAYAISI